MLGRRKHAAAFLLNLYFWRKSAALCAFAEPIRPMYRLLTEHAVGGMAHVD